MLNILKGAKVAQDDHTGDIYLIDCCDGPKLLTGRGSGSGSGSVAAWDAVILCETENAEIIENLVYMSGSYESIYNKLIAKQPVNVAVMIYASDGTATASYQCAATYIYYMNDGETEGILLYAQRVSGSVPFLLYPDGTITRLEE